MSDKQNPDLSKIIGLIMENPKLIEEISALVKSDEQQNNSLPTEELQEATVPDVTTPVIAEPDVKVKQPQRSNRTELLCALKPYVSKERAQAIDSMLSIAGILEVMRGK